jgi:hypothetical protein
MFYFYCTLVFVHTLILLLHTSQPVNNFKVLSSAEVCPTEVNSTEKYPIDIYVQYHIGYSAVEASGCLLGIPTYSIGLRKNFGISDLQYIFIRLRLSDWHP